MKKAISLLLCVLLSFSLCIPVFAADTPAQELTRITLEVKKLLSIKDAYSAFNGTPRDMGAMRYWNLDWSNEDGSSLSVTVDDTGKVMQLYAQAVPFVRNDTSGYAPSFSKVSADQAQRTAISFINRVLTGRESGKLLEEVSEIAPGVNYSFTVQILLNGILSANTAQVQVDAFSGEVSFYQRDDFYSRYVNEIPSAVPKVSSATAQKALEDGIALELQYVLAEDKNVVLRYMPLDNGDLYVDAQTGKLTDLNEAWNAVNYEMMPVRGGTQAADLSDNIGNKASEETLSDVEQETIKKMEGVLSKEKLDAAVRANTALGLSRFKLKGAEYFMDTKGENATCTLRYARVLTFGELEKIDRADYKEGLYQVYRTVTVDAKTGTLLFGWSGRPWCMKTAAGDQKTMQAAADHFLAQWQPERGKQTELALSENGYFSYERKENGYLYHSNGIVVEIDPGDGSVESFSCSWDDDLKFEKPDGLISAAAAKKAYCAGWKSVLRYIAYPVSVDTSIPMWKTYAEYCGGVAYRYLLGYTYESGNRMASGVDAKTGKLIYPDNLKQAPAYQDIANSGARMQIEKLANNGIRFSEETKFYPAKKLTQADLLVFLLNSCGWNLDTRDLDDKDTMQEMYEAAWSLNFLPKGQKDPTAAVTRLGLVKIIISASPYGKAAELTNIFRTSFSDAKLIPKKDLGYAAIAEGIGLVRGNAKHQFFPNRTATRQDAAAILYNYMSR